MRKLRNLSERPIQDWLFPHDEQLVSYFAELLFIILNERWCRVADGTKNLIPFDQRTEEEQKRIRTAGGIASGAARRRKRNLKQAADLYLSLPVTDRRVRNKIARDGVNPEDIDNQMAMIVGLTEAAVRGDARCAKVLVDLLGDSTVEEPTPDDGFMDALREEAGQIWQED